MTPDLTRDLYVASVSGGKDSAAMALHLMERGIPFRSVFMDTGWEHPATYDYLRGPLAAAIGPIEEIRGPLGMVDLIRKKGMFPPRVRRFCTQELKVRPMIRYLADLDCDPVNVVGIRAEESQARSGMPEWEDSTSLGCSVWRPLIRWSEQDVIDIHTRHGLRPNPLYLAGASRVGCWPCIFARKREIRMMADLDPGRIDLIERLENEVTEAAAARARGRGEEPGNPPTWFQCPDGSLNEDGTHSGRYWPIRKVVEWSRTRHGGRQIELFQAAPQDAGCARWGLCDTRADGDTA